MNGGHAHATDRIQTERLALVSLGAAALEAFAGGDVAQAAAEVGAEIGPECDLNGNLARMRLAQLQDDPSLQPWLLRAIVRRSGASMDAPIMVGPMMIGHIGFHTAPDPEYLRDLAPGAVEIGYTVYAPYRRNGYALEAAAALMRWATRTHGVTAFVASVSPGNRASLAMLRKLETAYRIDRIGRYVDPEDGPEDIYRLSTNS